MIPNASITVTSVQTGIPQTTKSNGSGNYIFPSLQPSDYTLSAQAPGFDNTTQSGLHLDVLLTLTSNIQLKLDTQSESITVSSAAELVELRESQLSTTVAQQQMTDLPLNGRTAVSLVQMVPGVTTFVPSATIGDTAGNKFGLNGQSNQ